MRIAAIILLVLSVFGLYCRLMGWWPGLVSRDHKPVWPTVLVTKDGRRYQKRLARSMAIKAFEKTMDDHGYPIGFEKATCAPPGVSYPVELGCEHDPIPVKVTYPAVAGLEEHEEVVSWICSKCKGDLPEPGSSMSSTTTGGMPLTITTGAITTDRVFVAPDDPTEPLPDAELVSQIEAANRFFEDTLRLAGADGRVPLLLHSGDLNEELRCKPCDEPLDLDFPWL